MSKRNSEEQGARIDLIIDRSDDCMNLCEIKSSNELFIITKDYAEKLKNKIKVFKNKTGAKKEILLTFITLNGLTENKYPKVLINLSVDIRELF